MPLGSTAPTPTMLTLVASCVLQRNVTAWPGRTACGSATMRTVGTGARTLRQSHTPEPTTAHRMTSASATRAAFGVRSGAFGLAHSRRWSATECHLSGRRQRRSRRWPRNWGNSSLLVELNAMELARQQCGASSRTLNLDDEFA